MQKQLVLMVVGAVVAVNASNGNNNCSELQTAVIAHCASHCGSCDVADTDAVLASCMVESPPGSGTEILGTQAVSDDCRGEMISTARHRADKECTAVQEAVIAHCSSHCGSCSEAAAAEVLSDCEVLRGDAFVSGASQVAAVCAGELVALHPPSVNRCANRPPTVRNGGFTVQFGNTRATLQCYEGYTEFPAGCEVVCKDGTWSGSFGSCICLSPADRQTHTMALPEQVHSGATGSGDVTDSSQHPSDSYAATEYTAMGICVLMFFSTGYFVAGQAERKKSALLRAHLRKMELHWDTDPEQPSIYDICSSTAAAGGTSTTGRQERPGSAQQASSRGTVWVGAH